MIRVMTVKTRANVIVLIRDQDDHIHDHVSITLTHYVPNQGDDHDQGPD